MLGMNTVALVVILSSEATVRLSNQLLHGVEHRYEFWDTPTSCHSCTVRCISISEKRK